MQLKETRYASTVNLNCTEASLVDETGTIKISSMAEFCSMVENGLAYMLKNLLVNYDMKKESMLMHQNKFVK